jgi:hypothetical protein
MTQERLINDLTETDYNTGLELPAWCKRAKYQGRPPEIAGAPDEDYYVVRSKSRKSRKGAPGYACTQNQLDNAYIWFRAVKEKDASRFPSLVQPYSFWRTSPTSQVLRVPVTTLNIVYREAAMLARRQCLSQGRRTSGRWDSAKNERVWYYTDSNGNVWVGVRLFVLAEYAGPSGLDWLARNSRKVTNVRWCDSVSPRY